MINYNNKGKPQVATAEITYDCNSPNIIESKSLKLYFNSLNNTKFNNITELEAFIQKDLEERVETDVIVTIHTLEKLTDVTIQTSFRGESLDGLDIECSVYQVDPSLLSVDDELLEDGFTERPAPRPVHMYPNGLESIGVIVGKKLAEFIKQHEDVLTGVKEHGQYCQPAFITFDNDKTAKFYDSSLREIVILQGWQIASLVL